MTKEITMPKLSDTMTEGLFAGWRKNIGDRIERGDIIGEVETDKAVMELESFASGILVKVMVQGGENVPVGTVLGLIGEEGDMTDSDAPIKPVSPELDIRPAASAVKPAVISASPAVTPAHTGLSHEKASPMVRRLAREQGLELELVKGSGPDGRISQDDLAAFARQQQKMPETAATSATPLPEAQPVATESVATTPMRQAIAATVTRSWQTIPHFSVTVEITMDACREIVSELKERPDHVGYNALVMKACAVVLLDFPLLRSGDPTSSNDIHINFAVSRPDGLLMPVIRQCQRLSVTEIENESSRLAEKCRTGRVTAEEIAVGTFSVSNLGMYGVDEFTALIMPGQTGILAIGAVRERPVVHNGQLAAAATMRVTLCSDHRSVDGAYAASFLKELQSVLEKPVLLLM